MTNDDLRKLVEAGQLELAWAIDRSCPHGHHGVMFRVLRHKDNKLPIGQWYQCLTCTPPWVKLPASIEEAAAYIIFAREQDARVAALEDHERVLIRLANRVRTRMRSRRSRTGN